MANLTAAQTKLTLNNLYRLNKSASGINAFSKAFLMMQGTGTVNVYIALDGAAPDTEPASLAEMSQIQAGIDGTIAFQSFDFRYIAIEQASGSNEVYFSGFTLEDKGAIS
jgi:hypothetical protein